MSIIDAGIVTRPNEITDRCATGINYISCTSLTKILANTNKIETWDCTSSKKWITQAEAANNT